MRPRWMFGALALMLSVGTVMAAASSAGASAGVTGSGNYSCKKLVGSLTFTPPLKNNGTLAETIKVTTTGTSCTGGKPVPTKVVGTATFKQPTNNCANLTKPISVPLKLSYTPLVLPSSFAGKATGGFTSTGRVTFKMTGKVAGSYPSLAATANALLTQTAAQVATSCAATTGLKTLTIASGTLTKF